MNFFKFCANTEKNGYNFVGDYFYQNSRCESVDSKLLREKVFQSLKTTRENRPGLNLKAVFVIRDGLSEGQYEMV